jgi:hypothetical protein
MTPALQDGAKEGWTGRYEDLRRGVVEEYAPVRSHWGLTLFLRQGLVAWMRAWPREPTAPKKSAPPPLGGSPIAFSQRCPLWQTQIALVWADMIVNRPREVRT